VGAVLAAFLLVADGDPPAASSAPAETRDRAQAAPGRTRSLDVAPEAQESATAATGTFVVHVVTAEDGSPLAGAEVRSDGGAPEDPSGVTGADGSVRLDGVAPSGWTRFTASVAGRVTRWVVHNVVGSPGESATIRLPAAAVLSLRAEDRRTGAPVGDALVTITGVGLRAEDTEITGADGESPVVTPAESVARVVVTATDYDDGVETVRLGAAGTTTRLIVRLARHGRMTGVVRAPDGTPVAGARVLCAPDNVPLLPSSSSGLGGLVSSATADDAGRFAVEWGWSRVRHHAVALAIRERLPWAPSANATGLELPEDGDELVHDFSLQAWGSLAVRARDSTGAPVPGASVYLTGPNTEPMQLSAEWDPAGLLRVGAVAPGQYQLVMFAEGLMGVQRIEVAPDVATTVAIEMRDEAPNKSALTVVDDLGRPVAGALVVVDEERTGLRLQDKTKTDQDGHAPLPLSPWRRLSVDVSAPGLLPIKALFVDDATQATRVVLNRPAVLTLRARMAVASDSPRDAPVLLVEGDTSIALQLALDDDDRARIELAPCGATNVCFVAPGCAGVVRAATLAAGSIVHLGDIELPPLQRVRGRVVDAAGHGIAGATVAFDVAERDQSTPVGREPRLDQMRDWTVTSARDGSFEVDWSLDSGRLPIKVQADGFVRLRSWIPIGRDVPLTVALSRGGVLWGEVADESGAPEASVNVDLIDARGTKVTTMRSDYHGWIGARLAAGRYVLRARDCDDADVTLTEGGDAQIHLVRRR
jgi:hypothetical protein